MNFQQALMECAGNKELIKEFDRLKGTNLSLKGSGLDLQIDKATGRLDADVEEFSSFCFAHIYLPVIEKLESERLTHEQG